MKENKCPICGKSGIPDFYSQDVVCPCCGSDLSIYRLIDQIESNTKSQSNIQPKTNKFTVYSFASLVVVLLIISCLAIIKVSRCSDNLEDSIGKYEALVIENETLKASVSELEATIAQPKESSAFKYVVREGDSFWGISKKLYGTGTKFQEIADANNLSLTDVLNVGDELIIK